MEEGGRRQKAEGEGREQPHKSPQVAGQPALPPFSAGAGADAGSRAGRRVRHCTLHDMGAPCALLCSE